MSLNLTIGSLFSGIGGLELGLERAGVGRTVWQVEQNEYCRAVLAKHWPDATRYEDVRDVGRNCLEPVDVICGGFPCQDISPAGTRRGLDGEKSGLWREFARIVAEVSPRHVVIENNGHRWRVWVPAVRRELYLLGYSSLPVRVRASDVGAWHVRDRVFVVAHAHGAFLRNERRGWSRESWQGAVESTRARSPWGPADAHRLRELQQKGEQPDERRWLGDGVGGWEAFEGTIEPALARGVHGIPDRVDAERALGNAVVPQVAEVVGQVIVRLETERRNAERVA